MDTMSKSGGVWEVLGVVIGTVVICVGIVGIWLQGQFYPPGMVLVTQATQKAIGMAFFLPSAVTAAGCLLIAPAILCGPTTAKWSPRRRTIVYVSVSATVIVLCYVASKIAAAEAA